jgi:histidyl-tRNA synthetase
MISKPKGTYDVLPDTSPIWHKVERTIHHVSKLFRYNEIRTPIFEKSDLFHREQSDTDIVKKETYDFTDRGNRMNTLRPEGTAGVVRSIIENKLYAQSTLNKFYYYGPMFRYERPQKGRFRQFTQFGAEAFGSLSPHLDVDIISYAVSILRGLKLKDVYVTLNSLGDTESKEAYKKALKSHLKPHIKTMCGDCQTRFEHNPLRILDCKVDHGHEALKTAPNVLDYLVEEDKNHFEMVKHLLDHLKIPYRVDPTLVRGLDYYTHTVFEIKVSETLLGQQNTICGGGRYNHLVEELGGPDIPAVGFAFGLERLLSVLESNHFMGDPDYTHLYLMPLSEVASHTASALAFKCRLGGLITAMDYENKSMKAQFKQADRLKARFVGIIGDEELEEGVVTLKDQHNKTQLKVPISDVYITIIETISKPKMTKECTCGKEE